MVYQPKPAPPDQINNSELGPFKVLLKGGLILGLLFVIFYILSAYIPSVLTSVTPKSFETSLGKMMHKRMKVASVQNDKLKKVLSLIEGKLDDDVRDSKFFTIDEKIENAYAAPGGSVYFTKAFLEAAESDNEILFVLGHELGHQKYRHPIKSLYTNFLSSALMALIGGVDQFSDLALAATQSNFSRAQETEADLYGLELVQKVYGHTDGAFNFFERMGKKYGALEKLTGSMFSSHPLSQERIEHLKKVCIEKYKESACSSKAL